MNEPHDAVVADTRKPALPSSTTTPEDRRERRLGHRTFRRLLTRSVRRRTEVRGPAPIPEEGCYTPRFTPHLCDPTFTAAYLAAEPYTLVSPDRAYVLFTLAQQARSYDGEFWECGTYKGGTAMILAPLARTLRLFDTFTGLPEVDADRDRLATGAFSDTSVAAVRARVEADVRPGLIPWTFAGLENHRVSLAHIDVDLYRSVRDCCEFIYPRLSGFMIFDDYGFKSCPGARQAVDEFFADKIEQPLVLPTGQAVVFKL